MIPRWLRFRIREVISSYRWLWRAAHDSASTRFGGALRFAACAAEDVLALGVWCLGAPLRHRLERERVVIPALVLAVVMMVSVQMSRTHMPPHESTGFVSGDVRELCGGSIYLGAITAPGDAHVTFAACENAVAESELCEGCDSEGDSRFVAPSRLRLTI